MAAADSARRRRQAEYPLSKPTGSSSSTAGGSGTLLIPVAGIVGIVVVCVILLGLALLIWKWKTRMKDMKMNRVSAQKYGVGTGVSSINSNDSTQKIEIHGSFFEADDLDRRRTSILQFKLPGRPGHKSQLQPKSRKRFQSSWFADQGSPRSPTFKVHTARGRSATIQLGADTKKPAQIHHPLSPASVRSRGISAPLSIVNGPPEPWTPLASAHLTIPQQALHRNIAPRSAGLDTLQTTNRQPPGKGASNLFEPPQSGKAEGDQRSLAPTGLSSDASVYSRSSWGHTSPIIAPPAAQHAVPTPHPRSQARNNPSTPPLPPSTTAFTYSSMYAQDVERQESAHDHYNHYRPRLMTAVLRYTPIMRDELLLQVGDTVRVIEEYRDGWCFVQHVGRMDSPRGMVPAVCLQERRRVVPVPTSAVGSPRSNVSVDATGYYQHRS